MKSKPTCDECGLEKPLVAKRRGVKRRCRDCSAANKKRHVRQHYLNNIDKFKTRSHMFLRNRQKEWKRYFQNKFGDPFCECCHKALLWPGSENKLDTVHFDHRRGDEMIKQSPAFWTRDHAVTLENIAIFESCDFGILCNRCNMLLPTDNRLEWLEKATEYAKKTLSIN